MQSQFENIKESWLLTHFPSIGSVVWRCVQGKGVAERQLYESSFNVSDYLHSKHHQATVPNRDAIAQEVP
jgi:hypothetical protein